MPDEIDNAPKRKEKVNPLSNDIIIVIVVALAISGITSFYCKGTF